ncbi:sigma-70 family RNA polymerase sigma factor [bacterium]|nr:sigma-70 family RNA polymerase sigma factor [bacterium]
MSPSTLALILRQAEQLSGAPEAAPDGDLVRRFVATRDEPAFAELLRRHGPMVWAACRQLLPAHADAEDAFQATFLALTRSARSIRRGDAVGGWLHGVAVRAATKLRRAAVRRRQREERVAGGEADRSLPEATWDALLAAVHEEVRRLPDPLRTAFVLCDLEGVPQPDAAVRLGWKAGTLTGRLCRARQLLLDRLTGRGLAPAAAVGAIGLGVTATAGPVPVGLVGRMVSLSRGADAPPVVLELVREVTPMALSWTKRTLAAALVAGGLGATLFPIAHGQQGGSGSGSAGGPPGAGAGPAGPGRLPGGGDGQPGSPPRAGGSGTGASGAPGSATGGSGFITWGSTGMAAARPGWEYKYVQQPRDVTQFKRTLSDLGAAGWEYCDHLEMGKSGAGEVNDLLVFKRPTGGSAAAGGSRSLNVPMMGGGFSPFPGGAGGFGGPGGTVGTPGGPPLGFGVPGGNRPGASGGGGGSFGPMGGPGGGGSGTKSGPASDDDPVVLRAKNVRAEEIATTLRTVFDRDGVDITADDRTNSVIVRGNARAVARVRALLTELDVPAAGGRGAP